MVRPEIRKGILETGSSNRKPHIKKHDGSTYACETPASDGKGG